MRWLSSKRNVVLMMVPTIVLYCIYIISPIFISVFYSFTKYSGIGKPIFTGLSNYERLLHNNIFLNAVKNSLVIMAVCMVVLVTLSFLTAVLLNTRKVKGSTASKAILFSPSIMAPIVVGIIWTFIFDPSFGCLNAFLDLLGLGMLKRQWIGGISLTPISVAVVYCWQQLGYMTTIFIAGLKMVPEELYESAMIDGAGVWQRMRYITMPMIKSTFSIVIVLVMNGSLKIFEVVLQLTNGGPNHYSETMVTYSYNTTFIDGEFGYGMAMAVVIFIICFGLSTSYLKLSSSKSEE